MRATNFRRWSTAVLKEFAIKGYVIDKKRMENGSFIGQDYFEHLLAEIHEIRLIERRFRIRFITPFTDILLQN